jgi:hypothetical protein
MDGSTLEADMHIALFADRLVGRLLETLASAGKESLKNKGYT